MPSRNAPLDAAPRRNVLGVLLRQRWVIWSLAGGGASGGALVLADCVARQTWEGVSAAQHLMAGFVLAGGLGSVFGTVALVIVALARALARVAPQRLHWGIAPLLGGIACGAAIWSTAHWMFSGTGIRASQFAKYGPYLAFVGAAFVGALGTYLFQLGVRWARTGRGWWTFALALVAALCAVAVVYVDLTFFVSLYSRLHTVLEVIAFSTAGAGAALVMIVAAQRFARSVLLGASVLATTGVVCLFAFTASASLRRWTSESLSHVWREPVYLGRVLARAQMVESYASNPRAWTGETMAGVHRLRERYDILTTACDPAWLEPAREPISLTTKAHALRGEKEPSVLIYYVDTLRADVARDPKIMPYAVRFAAQSLDFRNAYTTGSDTLHALPGMTGGRYDLFDERPTDLLRVAARAGARSVLFSPGSAARFLGKLLPRFKFDETRLVTDHALDKRVWGYGADQPTAERLVDSTLEWLRANGDRRFLGWVFNFDVHAWRELDEAYVSQRAARYGMREEEGKLALRYRVAARGVDEAFGRLLKELDALPMSRDLIVLFISDHGEALGREGFWVHSVFLWEALIRVPLYVRVPGLAPKLIEDRVSLVDLAPTLARTFDRQTALTAYHGEDLLTYAAADRPPRRFPLMLVSTEKEKLARLGLIDPVRPYKLVLPLEAAVPELYDLNVPDPDSADVSGAQRPQMLSMLSALVRSPLFPRSAPVESPEGVPGPVAHEGANSAP